MLRALATLIVLGGVAQAAPAQLCGRVFEAGGETPLPDTSISRAGADAVDTGADGRFCMDVPLEDAQDVALVVVAGGHDPLRVSEYLSPGHKRTVEYRLVPSANAQKYRSTTRGAGMHEGEHFTIKDEELQTAPGTGGDPLRVVASLPGVIAPIPILPIYVVRGGSPGMNGFFIDGIRVPQLFHLVFNEGVVHPRILDRMDFYAGGFDATFGRIGSGVIDASTRPGRTDAPAHGEVELRLYDASALLEVKLPGGASLLAAGRYGYPGPIIGAIQPGVDLTYWDYQFRLDWKGLTVEALGSYDDLKLGANVVHGVAGQFLVEFHRLQVREQYKKGRFQLEAGVVGGVDDMAIFSGQGVQKLSINGRINARYKIWWLSLAAGGEVELSRFSASSFTNTENKAAPDELGDLAGRRDGIVGGLYLQGKLSLDKLLHRPASITFGLRADAYHAEQVTLVGIDPRVIASYRPIDRLEMFAAFGQYSQAPSFPIPLPGIDTFALQLGLQKNVQGSYGLRVQLPYDLTASATGYYGRFTNINDTVIDIQSQLCTSPPPDTLKGLAAYTTRQVNGAGYGLEMLLRRSRGRVTGWVSYTLSRAERQFSCGLAPADFDQSHVLTTVVQVRLPWRLLLGIRLNVQTGRPYTLVEGNVAANPNGVSYRNNARMPTYVQVDLRLDREWIYKKWALAAFLELINLTYSESYYGVTYDKDPITMLTNYGQPQLEGFRFILPSIGVRARF